jgi:hypothetical protein
LQDSTYPATFTRVCKISQISTYLATFQLTWQLFKILQDYLPGNVYKILQDWTRSYLPCSLLQDFSRFHLPSCLCKILQDSTYPATFTRFCKIFQDSTYLATFQDFARLPTWQPYKILQDYLPGNPIRFCKTLVTGNTRFRTRFCLPGNYSTYPATFIATK